jgi:hypothetical protein
MTFALVYPMLICTAVNNERYLGLHVECPIFLPYFKQIWSFLTDFHSSPLSNFMKICPLEEALIHVDRGTDMTKIIG